MASENQSIEAQVDRDLLRRCAELLHENDQLRAQRDELFRANNAVDERRRETARELSVARATINALQEALWERNKRIHDLRHELVGNGRLIGSLKAALEKNQDTGRLGAVIQQCADVELTCGGVWRVSAVAGDFEDPDLRVAIDDMAEASKR